MPEVESSRTSLASRPQSPQKLPCPRLENSTSFWIVEILLIAWKKILEGVFYWRTPEKFFWRPFFRRSPENFCEGFFCRRTLVLVSLVLGLEHSCPWPREGLSLALASDFFLCPWPRALCLRLHLYSMLLPSRMSYKLIISTVIIKSKSPSTFIDQLDHITAVSSVSNTAHAKKEFTNLLWKILMSVSDVITMLNQGFNTRSCFISSLQFLIMFWKSESVGYMNILSSQIQFGGLQWRVSSR